MLTGHARGESTRPAVLRSTTTSKWLLGGPCLTPRVRGVVLNIRQELQFWVRNIYNDIFGTRAQIREDMPTLLYNKFNKVIGERLVEF